MQHSFDVEIAEKYGILEAILLQYLWFWIEKNKANEKNFYDGTCWTYNSTKAFIKLFPYMTQRQIQNALKNLKDKGIIKTGNYNKSAYDRTLWYAFTELGNSIMQKCKMEDANLSNGLCENVTPIPDINTYIDTDNNTINNKTYNQDIYSYIENLFGITLGSTNYEDISSWLSVFDEEIIKYAADKCVEKGKRNLSYLFGILKVWRGNGYKTILDIKDSESNKIDTRFIPEGLL